MKYFGVSFDCEIIEYKDIISALKDENICAFSLETIFYKNGDYNNYKHERVFFVLKGEIVEKVNFISIGKYQITNFDVFDNYWFKKIRFKCDFVDRFGMIKNYVFGKGDFSADGNRTVKMAFKQLIKMNNYNSLQEFEMHEKVQRIKNSIDEIILKLNKIESSELELTLTNISLKMNNI
jgi:hypothetical protein